MWLPKHLPKCLLIYGFAVFFVILESQFFFLFGLSNILVGPRHSAHNASWMERQCTQTQSEKGQ